MKIELWGTYPPPIGGVSIHVYRLIHNLHKLDSEIVLKDFGSGNSGFSYVKSVKSKWWEFLRLLFVSPKIIHLHSNNIKAFLLLYLFGSKHQIGITIHNKNLVKIKSGLQKCIVRCFLKKVSFIILNDEDYKNALINKFHCKKDKIHILPAFLPPIEAEYKGLDDDILDFRKQHHFLLSANAYKLRLEDGVDVYGLDLLIKLVEELKRRKIDVGLIFCLPTIGNLEYYQKCLSVIEAQGLHNDIYIIQRPLINGFEVWKLSDLFIRPTFTDIEGLSVKEALFCGTPAIASDVCKRPLEAIIFKNRDFDDLLSKVLEIFNNKKKKEICVTPNDDTTRSILSIYNSIRR